MSRFPPPQLNLNVRGLPNSATVAINERSKFLETQGRTIYRFGLGQSPFPVPDCVIQSLKDHAHEKDYLPVRGLRELRHAVAHYHESRHDIERSADDVLIGPGSKELMFLLQMVYYGDLVIPAPAWVSYAPQAQILGRKVQMIQTSAENGWRLSADDLHQLCRKDPGRPRVLILNYPANPTGMTYSLMELKALADAAREEGIVLLSDEIYGELHHQGEHLSIARFYPEGTIISSGLSKWCGAGGWRLGTFLFPPSMRWLLEAMASAASETFTSTSAPIQYAAVRAFEGGEEIEDYLNRSRKILAALGPWCVEQFRKIGAECTMPAGGFYLFPNFKNLADKLATRGIHDAATLAEQLLQATGVAALPGTDFGQKEDDLSLRLAYVDFDGEKVLQALESDPDIDETFLRQHCPKIVTGIENMCAWLAS